MGSAEVDIDAESKLQVILRGEFSGVGGAPPLSDSHRQSGALEAPRNSLIDSRIELGLKRARPRFDSMVDLSEEGMRRFLGELAEAIGADRLTIYLIEESARSCRQRYSSKEIHPELSFRLEKSSFVGFAISKRTPLIIDDARDERATSENYPGLCFDGLFDRATRYITKEALLFPIIVGADPVGAIEALNSTDGRPFGGRDLKALEEIADLIGARLKRSDSPGARAAFSHRFDPLVRKGLIDSVELDQASRLAKLDNIDLADYLTRAQLVTKEKTLEALGEFYRLEYVDLENERRPSVDLLKFFRGSRADLIESMERSIWAPFRFGAGRLTIIAIAPERARSLATKALNDPSITIAVAIALESDIRAALRSLAEAGRSERLTDIAPGPLGETTVLIDNSESAGSGPIGLIASRRLLERTLIAAMKMRASAIYIESAPDGESIAARFRIAGELTAHRVISGRWRVNFFRALTELAGLDHSTIDRGARGAFQLKSLDSEGNVEMILSILPARSGLSAIIECAYPPELIPIERLGFSADQLELIRVSAERSDGGALIVTGSDRELGLKVVNSILDFFSSDEKESWAIEAEPIAALANVKSFEPESGSVESYLRALKLVRRIRPDIIMIDQIKDPRIFSSALEAARSKALIIGYAPSVGALNALNHFLADGIDRFILAENLLLLVGSRSIRSIAPRPKRRVRATTEQIETLKEAYGRNLWPEIAPSGRDIFIHEPLERERRLSGRSINLFETLKISDALRRLIRDGAREVDIRAGAFAAGMRTIKQIAVKKTLAGEIEIGELKKIADR